MWCVSCRQDVAGLKSQEVGQYECPRCGGNLCDQTHVAALECGDSSPLSLERHITDLSEPPAIDTWELDEQLRHVARLLGLKTADHAPPDRARLDPSQPAVSGWHCAGQRRAAEQNRARGNRRLRLSEILSSVTNWLGMAILTCGASLLGWAVFSSRAELQTIGLLTGTCGLLMLAFGTTLRLGQADTRLVPPSPHRRIDSKSPGSRHELRSRRRERQQSDKAA